MNSSHLLGNSFTGPEGQEDMPYLLTPGPLTTSRTVKLALLADWGSRDVEFRALVKNIRDDILTLAGADETYECVIMQGSGTFAIEAALGSLRPAKRKKLLIAANGAYGERAIQIAERLGVKFEALRRPETHIFKPAEIAQVLEADKTISAVWIVHCETTTGLINPISEIAREVQARQRHFMVDAMSSFGALPLNMAIEQIDVMVSSANKCIEGIPGFSYVVVKRALLEEAKGQSHSVVLDLYEQWKGLESNGQFRFTPPTHALVAFHQALRELHDEGGIEARHDRYRRNAHTLVTRLKALGFKPLLDEHEMGPIIQTFLAPADPQFDFEKFYEGLRRHGFAIYPGKLTKRASFRIGTIGQVNEQVMMQVATAIESVMKEMGIRDASPGAL